MRKGLDTVKSDKKRLSKEEVRIRSLIDSLRDNVVEFSFLKVDGTIRAMKGTRNEAVIRSYEGDKQDKRTDDLSSEEKIARQVSSDSIVVYDVEAKGFRTFKPSRLLSGQWKESKINGTSWEGKVEDTAQFEDDKLGIVELLTKEVVDIVFIKADGSERQMRATRINSYDSSLVELNDPEEMKKQVEKGTIKVFDIDKGEMRAFNLSRLKGYKLPNDSDYHKVDFSFEAIQKQNVDESQFYDVTSESTTNLIKVLNDKVVRLVFVKKDKTVRVMYGTRNSEIIDLYIKKGATRKGDDSSLSAPEKIDAQVKGDYITIFDLEAREFKTFKPSTLMRYDADKLISSWIEFKPEDDGWFQVVYEGKDIKEVYDSKNLGRYAKEIGEEVSVKRVKFEYKQKEFKEVRENLDVRGDEEERYKEAMVLVDKAVKSVNANLTSYDLAVFNKMKEVSEKVKEKYDDADNKSMVLSEVKVLESKKLVIYNFNWGRDVFIFHPRFALNGVTHKVYADRTGEIKFTERARISKAEKSFQKIIKMSLVLITKRRKTDKFSKELSDIDVRRLTRARVIVNNLDDIVKRLGLVFKFKTDNGRTVLMSVGKEDNPKFNLIVTPQYIYDAGKKKMIYEAENEWSVTKNFIDNVYKNPSKLEGLSKEQAVFVVKLIAKSLDLRKRVEHNGKRI